MITRSTTIKTALYTTAVTLILIACGQEEESSRQVVTPAGVNTVIAQVGSVEISAARYNRYLQRIPDIMREGIEPGRYIDALIEEELLVQEGEARGLHRSPRAQAVAEGERLAALQRLLYARVGIAPSVPSEDSLRAYFARSPYNRKVRFSLLMVRDSTAVAPLLAKIRQGVDFEELSQLHSQDPRILERNADMGYHRWGETMPAYSALTEKAFSMELGQLAGPLKVADGFFLIKLTDVHPVSFEQERDTIEKLFMREDIGRKLLAYYDSLHVRYDVRYQDAGLAALRSALAGDKDLVNETLEVVSYEGGMLSLARALEMMRGASSIDTTAFDLAVRREFARQVLASLEVVRLGLVDDQEVSASAETARRQYVVRRLKEQLLVQAQEPNINALRLFFEEHKARYEVPEKVEVDRLLTDDLQEGRRVVERLRSGQNMRDDRFVSLIYGSGAWQGENPVSRALRAEEGTVHGPFDTDNGYIVVRIKARRAAHYPSLDEVREQVEIDWREDQSQKILKEFAEELRKRRAAEISINQERLQRLSQLPS